MCRSQVQVTGAGHRCRSQVQVTGSSSVVYYWNIITAKLKMKIGMMNPILYRSCCRNDLISIFYGKVQMSLYTYFLTNKNLCNYKVSKPHTVWWEIYNLGCSYVVPVGWQKLLQNAVFFYASNCVWSCDWLRQENHDCFVLPSPLIGFGSTVPTRAVIWLPELLPGCTAGSV